MGEIRRIKFYQSGAEGEDAVNSQAEGPYLDETLESIKCTEEAISSYDKSFRYKRQRRTGFSASTPSLTCWTEIVRGIPVLYT